MSAMPDTTAAEARRATTRSMTIGAVCKALSPEFPDISISKIRYLEDQRLLAPQRSAGARICCSRFASRSAEVRNTRRLRPPTP